MKVLAIGEVMMRLTPPSHKMIEQTDTLDLSFSGTGLNILSGLSRNNVKTSLLTGLPDNSVGKAATVFTRKLGVDTEWICHQGNHIGTYFLELGFGNRPSQVTYLNREASSFCSEVIPDNKIEAAVESHDIIHICGIALSTSLVSRQLILRAVKFAFETGKKIIFDFNYRPSLNTRVDHEQLFSDYLYILERSHLVFGSLRDLAHFYQTDSMTEEALIDKLLTDFKEIEWFTGTTRTENQGLSGWLITNKGERVVSPPHVITVFDRIGTGDAYASGIILGYIRGWSLQETVDFATCAADLAHTTFGDSPILDESFIRRFMTNPEAQVFR